MLIITQLDAIEADRLSDAQVLLQAGRFDGAVYLAGYAVEMALKARICATLRWTGFPEASHEWKGLLSLKTHDLEILLRFSGVEDTIKTTHLAEWSTALDWDPATRYRASGRATVREASDMISAAAILVAAL